jgi:hypothetical protein
MITTSKAYLWTMSTHGLEFGHGAAGEYAAHAHGKVVDVVFAPDKLTVAGSGTRLAVVLPNTLFGNVETTAFWFLKFFPVPCEPSMPDKTESAPSMPTGLRGLFLADGEAHYAFDMFDPRTSTTTTITLALDNQVLTVESPSFGQLVLT